jgi:predicted HNH restriction endonuclease
LDESVWNGLDQVDVEDETYLENIQNEIKAKGKIIEAPKGKIIRIKIGSKIIYGRNPAIAVASLTKAKFTCEINSNHKTFIAEKTKAPYVEAHHFVPMKFQDNYPFPLDCVENVISLCPNCHKGIHLGVIEHKKELITTIYHHRKSINNFDIESLYSFYNFLKPFK